jgi:hypothetical protein
MAVDLPSKNRRCPPSSLATWEASAVSFDGGVVEEVEWRGGDNYGWVGAPPKLPYGAMRGPSLVPPIGHMPKRQS